MIPNGMIRATAVLTAASDPRTRRLAVLVAILTGCGAVPQPGAMAWLETEYLADPTRR